MSGKCDMCDTEKAVNRQLIENPPGQNAPQYWKEEALLSSNPSREQ